MIITNKQKRKALNELLQGFVKEHLLTELNLKQIGGEFQKQTNMNFKSHGDKVKELIEKGIYPQFVDFANGIAVFKIKSSEWKLGHGFQNDEYEMAIRFYDWDRFFDDPQLTLAQRVTNMMNGNLGVACSCPSFTYNYGYQTNIKGSELFTDEFKQYQSTMPAPITNPDNIGIGCKHLNMLLNPYALKFAWAPTIMKTIKDKLPKPSAISPSAANSKQQQKKTGIKHG
jgi:hypothetical protein